MAYPEKEETDKAKTTVVDTASILIDHQCRHKAEAVEHQIGKRSTCGTSVDSRRKFASDTRRRRIVLLL